MIVLEFEGFKGSAADLALAVRRGGISATALPILLLVDQALARVKALGLEERSELLPHMTQLLLFKLRATLHVKQVLAEDLEDLEAEDAHPILQALVELEEAILFLQQRSKERAHILPVPAPPLPRDRRLRPLPLDALVRAVAPFAQRAELDIEPERFGLREAWERLKGVFSQVRKLVFSRLPFSTWTEQTVGFSALLEAARVGQVKLNQQGNFADLEVEYLMEETLPLFAEPSKEPVS